MDIAPKEHDETSASTTDSPASTKVTEQPKQTTTTSIGPRNFLAAFILTLSFGPLGLRHFYLGDKKLGWTRLGLFAGGYLLMAVASVAHIGALIIIAFLALFAAWIWALVDFFYVYNAVKTDADGQPLTITPRDKKWAKILYIGTIVASILAIIFWVALTSLIISQMPEGLNSRTNSSDSPSYQEFIKELEKQQQTQSY